MLIVNIICFVLFMAVFIPISLSIVGILEDIGKGLCACLARHNLHQENKVGELKELNKKIEELVKIESGHANYYKRHNDKKLYKE